MTAANYTDRLIAEAREEIQRRQTAVRCDSCGGLIMHRSEHWLAAMADQLEAARSEIDRLRAVAGSALIMAKPVTRSDVYERMRADVYRGVGYSEQTEAIPLSSERDALRRKLGQIAKYADDLDANGGPEDGGSYAYLAVAKALRDILKDKP